MRHTWRNTGAAFTLTQAAGTWQWSLVGESGETWAQGSADDQEEAMSAAWEANQKIADHGSNCPNIFLGRE